MKNLLPIDHLTSFEEYMRVDHSSAYEMRVIGTFVCKGSVDEARFRDSLVEALHHHPMFSSTFIVQPRFGGWLGSEVKFGFSKPDLAEILDWNLSIDWFPNEPINTKDIRARFYMRKAPQPNAFMFGMKFHHVVSDGIGIAEFIRTLFGIYRNFPVTDRLEPDKVFRLAVNQLKQRHQLRRSRDLRIKSLFWDLKRTLRFALSVPAILVNSIDPRKTSLDWSRVTADLPAVTVCFDKHELSSLKQKSKNLSCTINDLLLKAQFEATRDHLQQQNTSQSKTIRINVLVSLRDRDSLIRTACNQIGYVFFDRTLADTKKSKLLNSISLETSQIKAQQTGFGLIRMLSWLRTISLLRPILSLPTPMTTTGLSNLGVMFPAELGENRPMRTQDFELESYNFISPLRRGTSAFVVVYTHNDVLTMSLTSDPKFWSAEDGLRYMERFKHYALQECSLVASALPT
jgi:hypothetical protein